MTAACHVYARTVKPPDHERRTHRFFTLKICFKICITQRTYIISSINDILTMCLNHKYGNINKITHFMHTSSCRRAVFKTTTKRMHPSRLFFPLIFIHYIACLVEFKVTINIFHEKAIDLKLVFSSNVGVTMRCRFCISHYSTSF